MRIQQLQSLNEFELDLLFYVMNDRGLKNPPLEKVEELIWFKQDAIVWKLSQIEPSLNEDGKKVFHELMRKLNRTPYQEIEDYDKENKSEYTQLEFQL